MLAPPPETAQIVRTWDDALKLLRAHSPDYVTSLETVERAEAQSRIALAAVLPTLNGQASYTHQFLTKTAPILPPALLPNLPASTIPPPDVLALGATLAWPVVNPRGYYGIGTSKRNVEAARMSFEDQRRTIATAAVNAMLATLAASRAAELNRVGLRSSLERLSLAETRLKFGQGTPLDVDRASQDVAASRALLIAGDESLLEAREALGQALGSATPLAAPGDLDLEGFEGAVARTCHLNTDIEKRPDVKAARLRVEIAARAITDAKLQISPTLSLVSQLNYASAVTFGPLTTWSAGAVLAVPFYDGGVRYGALRDARAAAEQASASLVTARLGAIVASAQAARSVGVSQASRDVAREQRDLAKRVDERTRDGYARGFGTSLDLVVSAQALRQAELSLVIADFQLAEARANAVLANAECVY
jgi:outer membrane protein TolC